MRPTTGLVTISRSNQLVEEGATTGRAAQATDVSSLVNRRVKDVTVLHVDDEPSFAEMTKVFLERLEDDLEVVTETSARDALETLEAREIDGIISDYQMPRMDGLELLEAVRAKHPELPFILCTARGSEEVASEAIATGVTDYIQKGTDTQQYEVLANRVMNAVDRHHTSRRLWETLAWSSQLMQQSLAGVYIVQDGRFVFVNDYFADLFGYDPAELVGEDTGTLSVEDPSVAAGASCLEAVPPGVETARYQGHGRSRGGYAIEFDVEVAAIEFNGAAAVLGTVVRADGSPGTAWEGDA